MNMRPSRVLRKLRAGEVVNCFKVGSSDPRIVEIAAMCGFDCIWLCMEHTPSDYTNLENQVRAAKIYDTDVMVRVAKGPYSNFIRPLEMDASGIMVPHLMSVAEAKEIVRTTRFHPLGLRPADGGSVDGAYCNIPFKDYIAQANRERFVIVQIEDPQAMDELDEICQIDGIDMIFFGPGDYSQAIGDPGNLSNPKVLDARKKIVDTALKFGKFAGTVASPENVEEIISIGYKFVNIGSDVVGLSSLCKERLKIFGKKSTSNAGVYS
jgi:4-hydroxy-2-oxoheptanedioate aldolase